MIKTVKNFLIVVKKSTADAKRPISKRAIQKTAEGTAQNFLKTDEKWEWNRKWWQTWNIWQKKS